MAFFRMYRVHLTSSQTRFVLAADQEDAAWQAFKLSKELNEQLLDVILDEKKVLS